MESKSYTMDFADGILLFLNINSKREKVHAVTGRRCHRRIDHDDRVAVMDPDRAVGLFTVTAELERQGLAGEIHGIQLVIHTFHSFSRNCTGNPHSIRSAVCYHMKTPPGIFKG